MNRSLRLISIYAFVAACAGFSIGLAAQGQSTGQSSAATGTAATATPTVDQILTRYMEAEGGRTAWQKLNSRVSTGTIEVPSMSLVGTVEIREKAPDRVWGIITINGASFRQGYNGTVGWTDDPQNGLREETGPELAETKRDADFYHPLDLRKLYTKLTVSGREKVGDRETYLVVAEIPEGGEPDRIYFDTQTSLPIRIVSEHHGADGVTKFTEDFDDFRMVDGVKLPFVLHQLNGDTSLTITLNEVHHNVPLEDSQFEKPAAE